MSRVPDCGYRDPVNADARYGLNCQERWNSDSRFIFSYYADRFKATIFNRSGTFAFGAWPAGAFIHQRLLNYATNKLYKLMASLK